MSKNKSFEEIAAELESEQKSPCIICDNSEREIIEKHHSRGMSYARIADVLLRQGAIRGSRRGIRDKVRDHFANHAEKRGVVLK